MDASNGPPVDSRLIAAPTVAPPPGVRPLGQPMFQQSLGPQLGLQGLAAAGFRPAQFAQAAAASGMSIFQAQPPPMAAQSLPPNTGPRKAAADRSKAAPMAGSARKQCNCKNSRCLKLYCECFASGRYCENCNCVQCFNNREHEATRQSAVEAILERNPNAFRPKIQSAPQPIDPTPTAASAVVANAAVPGRHLKGCNCKKSSCLKKYCECFQAGIYCSDNCKCVECKNFEDANAGVGGPGGNGSKRLRYGSAPPPPVPGSSLGLAAAAAAQGVPLGAIRSGLLQTGGFGALVQHQQQQAAAAAAVAAAGIGSLQMGLAGAVAAAAAAAGAAGPGGGPRPGGAAQGVIGNLAGLGPGGMASLPQALSLALAAASGSAPQLLSLQSTAPGGQSGPSLVVAPAPQPLAAAAVAAAAAAAVQTQLPLRAKMQEVVNGMVKRSVIEELCRLLWMVADDEAASARVTTVGVSAAAVAAAGGGGTPLLDNLNPPPLPPQQLAGQVVVCNGGAGSGTSHMSSGQAPSITETVAAGQASDVLVRQCEEAMAAAAAVNADGDEAMAYDGLVGNSGAGDGGGSVGTMIKLEFDVRDAGRGAALNFQLPIQPLGHSHSGGAGGRGDGEPEVTAEAALALAAEAVDRTQGEDGDGATDSRRGGHSGGTQRSGDLGFTHLPQSQSQLLPLQPHTQQPQQPQSQQHQHQQQSSRQHRGPGLLYARKERVVLEEFLSIMNKISDTAAKKLQQHNASVATSTPMQAGLLPAPPSLHLQQQQQQQPSAPPPPQQQQQQPYGYPQVLSAPSQPQQQQPVANLATAATGAGASALPGGGAFMAGARPPAGNVGHGPMVAQHGFPNGQVLYPVPSSYPAAAAGGGGSGGSGVAITVNGPAGGTTAATAAAPLSVAFSSATGPDSVAAVAPSGGVPSVSGTMAAATTPPGGLGEPEQQPLPGGPALPIQHHPPQHHPQQQQHLPAHHGGVPVILAPPRGSHSSFSSSVITTVLQPTHPHPQQQQQGQQQQPLNAIGGIGIDIGIDSSASLIEMQAEALSAVGNLPYPVQHQDPEEGDPTVAEPVIVEEVIVECPQPQVVSEQQQMVLFSERQVTTIWNPGAGSGAEQTGVEELGAGNGAVAAAAAAAATLDDALVVAVTTAAKDGDHLMAEADTRGDDGTGGGGDGGSDGSSCGGGDPMDMTETLA
ncbi:hypothetical protein Vretifemale_16084 [Volvox reticuliferus]|uniref:CRC domain-containing protein n=2 Tax=Volvox reticuliferus TaxID=1737510 RepID=A0A8J4CUT0_9CHLO|nr:hypothetical protein Vretifemale_16084 [Volvox reticuliferus]